MNSFVIRNQWPRMRSLNSMLISLKALVVFKVNFLLQLILQLLQSGVHHVVLWKLSMKFWGRNLILLSHKECLDKLPSQLTWLTPLFVSLRTTERLDLDHKDLYKAIRRPCYFTPTPEDIFPELSDVSCFSILDASSGYWNIKLKWGLLCISFNSPFGRYRFLHLPFGLISAPDISKEWLMKPLEIYLVSLWLQTTLCMGAMTVVMMRISMLSCNVPVRPACTFTWISSSVPRSRSPVT